MIKKKKNIVSDVRSLAWQFLWNWTHKIIPDRQHMYYVVPFFENHQKLLYYSTLLDSMYFYVHNCIRAIIVFLPDRPEGITLI